MYTRLSSTLAASMAFDIKPEFTISEDKSHIKVVGQVIGKSLVFPSFSLARHAIHVAYPAELGGNVQIVTKDSGIVTVVITLTQAKLDLAENKPMFLRLFIQRVDVVGNN